MKAFNQGEIGLGIGIFVIGIIQMNESLFPNGATPFLIGIIWFSILLSYIFDKVDFNHFHIVIAGCIAAYGLHEMLGTPSMFFPIFATILGIWLIAKSIFFIEENKKEKLQA